MRALRRAQIAAPDEFEVGSWLVRPTSNEILQRGVTRRVRRQLMDLLVLLASRPAQVVGRKEILDKICGTQFVSNSILPRCIGELRQLLGDDPEHPTFIETVPTRGYRLIAPIADRTPGASKPRQPSILVAPFNDLSEHRDQQWACDGMREQIIGALTRVVGLRVIARSSAFLLGREPADLNAMRTRINVDHALGGSIQRSADHLRITVHLVDVGDQSHLWSHTYCAPADKIFDLQDEIAQMVVAKLKVELLGAERERLTRRHTNNVEAHSWYLKGLHYWNQRTREAFRCSRECFVQAMKEDPGYALPYVGLANCHSMAAFYGGTRPGDSFPEARRFASTALAIDPELAEPHATLGLISYLYDRDWPRSEEHFKRALALSPNYPITWVWYALCLSWAGQPDKAAGYLERAYWADPLSPLPATTRGVLLYQEGHYREAQNQLQQVVHTDRNYALAHFHLGRVCILLGEHDQAIGHAAKAVDLGLPCAKGVLAFAHARAGQIPRARRIVSELIQKFRRDYASPAVIAYAFVGLRNVPKAASWLTEARRLRDPILCQVPSDPLVNAVCSEPCVARLLRRGRASLRM